MKAWNKGQTKETNKSVLKISRTMKRKRLDNFKAWRDHMKNSGRIKSVYPSFPKTAEVAELIGVLLGDGHIERFPRTERLYIFSNANNHGFIQRYEKILTRLFKKKIAVKKVTGSECVRLSVYEKNISKRIGIPCGSRAKLHVRIPTWISNDASVLRCYIRGLYEAEGSFCVHKPTSTYKFIFVNHNDSLLDIVFTSLERFGFHPHRSLHKIQLSRKDEVMSAVDFFKFRDYTD
ncbi:hypothetical protein HY623_01070 [Candidatus Uhrbacteria bacterium]|nr:hypothetical protein [Candidatus Uhrbacteria bacterium]